MTKKDMERKLKELVAREQTFSKAVDKQRMLLQEAEFQLQKTRIDIGILRTLLAQ